MYVNESPCNQFSFDSIPCSVSQLDFILGSSGNYALAVHQVFYKDLRGKHNYHVTSLDKNKIKLCSCPNVWLMITAVL